MALYFECCPTTLPDEQVNEYLLLLRDTQSPSYSYFKHTVYGLRLAFRLIGREDKAIRLPSIQRIKSLPTMFSRAEVKKLIATPKWQGFRLAAQYPGYTVRLSGEPAQVRHQQKSQCAYLASQLCHPFAGRRRRYYLPARFTGSPGHSNHTGLPACSAV